MGADVASGEGVEAPAEREIVVIGFGRRLAATVLDAVVVLVFSMLGSTAAGVIGLVLGMYSPEAEEIANRFVIAAGLIISVGYYMACWANGGQTLGNFSTMIRVVSKDGSPVTWGKAILRFVGYIVSAIPFSLGFLWVAFDSRRQGWHDKIAGTYVIPADEHFSAQDSVRLVPSDPGKGWIWAAVWAVLAIASPAALLGSMWVLGPFVVQLAKFITGRG
jgi:uncharacterized RDD family membrane protein YckC